jgi:hypothetical protein
MYLVKTPQQYFAGQYASAHTENPSSPYYSASGAQEAGYSDLTQGGGSTAVQAIDGWLKAPFHAIGMLRAQLTQVAFANDPATGYAGLDVIQGIDSNQPATTTPILFPGQGATTDLVRFNADEVPSPLETCGWLGRANIGLPLVALLTAAPDPGASAELLRQDGVVQSSAAGSLCVVDEYTYRSSDPVYGQTGASILHGDHAVLLIPSSPLSNGAYSATIHQPGRPDISWSFQTFVPPPQNTSLPAISGSATTGGTLTVAQGSWTGAPISYAAQWMRCDNNGDACQPIVGATDRRYDVTAADTGRTLRVQETASNDGGAGNPATSDHTAVVQRTSGVPPDDSHIGTPGHPGYRRSGSRVYLYWYGVPGATGYRVTIRVAGRISSLFTRARHLSLRIAPSHAVRVTVRAIDGRGQAGSPSDPIRIPRST